MRVQIINETCGNTAPGDWRLCFQWCRYIYDDGSIQHGYRFIWRHPNNNLQPARGQARIPSIAELNELVEIAKSEGWGDYDANKLDANN